jgi:pimeloyl-ACP methyl ester carboxylesterase
VKSKAETGALLGPLKQIDAGLLNVGYVEAGPAEGPAVILLHGWPYDIHSYVDVASLLAVQGYRVVVPHLRGFGTTRFLSQETFRNGQQSVVAVDTLALMDALDIDKAIVAGFDWGARTADIVAALWPERCKGLVSVSGYLIGNQAVGKLPLPPEAELQWWYQYYFATDRGRAGYDKYRHRFARLIWRIASPQWNFDNATFDRSAASFDNPDHVNIVIHNYRWRWGWRKGRLNTTSWKTGSPKDRSSPCPPSHSRVTRTVRRIRSRVRMPRNSRARICTGRSRAASDTTFPRKLPKRSPRP